MKKYDCIWYKIFTIYHNLYIYVVVDLDSFVANKETVFVNFSRTPRSSFVGFVLNVFPNFFAQKPKNNAGFHVGTMVAFVMHNLYMDFLADNHIYKFCM